MRSKLVILLSLTALGSTAHAGEIYRCVAANGDLTFTNLSCPEKTQVQHIGSYQPVPDMPAQTWQAAADAAAASARQAQEAAAQAQAVLYRQAQMAYQEPSEPPRELPYDSSDYPLAFIPLYPAGRPRFSNQHHARSPERHHQSMPVSLGRADLRRH